jgi:hypothetical protein
MHKGEKIMQIFKPLSISFVFCLLTIVVCRGQDSDSLDLVSYYDSTKIDVRHFNEAQVEKLKEDPKLTYSADRASITVWQQLWWFFLELIDALFSETASTSAGRFLIYIIAIVVLVFIIIRVLKIESFKIFYSRPDLPVISHSVIEENIHEMDLDKAMEDALRRKDFRAAIRLTFLQALKALSDKHLIYWEPGKTNRDYLNELQSADLKKGFYTINYYFEYAWYGNFTVDDKLYEDVRKAFSDWKTRV